MTTDKAITKSRGQQWIDEHVLPAERRDRLADAARGSGIDPAKLEAILVRAVIDNPSLMGCQPASLFSSMMTAAELGLSPSGANNGAYFAVYKGECKLGLGFNALIDLATRDERIRSFKTEAVWPTDLFEVHAGTDNKIVHIPNYVARHGKPTLYYAVAFFVRGGFEFEVMTEQQVERIRQASRNAEGAPWKFQFEEMAKKTVLRRLIKRLPLQPRAAEVIEDADLVDGFERVAGRRRVGNTAEEIAARVLEELPPQSQPDGPGRDGEGSDDSAPAQAAPRAARRVHDDEDRVVIAVDDIPF